MSREPEVCFTFGRDDLLRTRFAIAPLLELVGATYVLRLPRHFPEHHRWVATALPRVDAMELHLLHAVNPLGRTSWPNFNAPPPITPHSPIEDELARVASTHPDVVRSDIHRAHPEGVPPASQPFLDDPAGALAELVTQMRSFWDAALAPSWGRMSAFLEGEIAARARRVVAIGGHAAFADLDPTVTWDGKTLKVAPVKLPPRTVSLDGRGLLLIPSVLAFGTWPRIDPPWEPALTYQPPGVADMWARGEDRTGPTGGTHRTPASGAPAAPGSPGDDPRTCAAHRMEPRRREHPLVRAAPLRPRRTPPGPSRGVLLPHRRRRLPHRLVRRIGGAWRLAGRVGGVRVEGGRGRGGNFQ